MKKEIDLKRQIKYPITVCSSVLFLLGISTLLLNLPDAIALDFRSILSAINALAIIIGVIGIIRLTRWGLYCLLFSLILPIILIPFRLTTTLVMLVSIINLVIFIDIFMIYKARGCEDVNLQKKLIRLSKKYTAFFVVIFAAIFLAVVFSILSCAFGNLQALSIAQALGLYDFAITIRDHGILKASAILLR